MSIKVDWNRVTITINGAVFHGFASVPRPPDPLGPVRRLRVYPTPNVAARQIFAVMATGAETEETLLARIADDGMRDATREALRHMEAP